MMKPYDSLILLNKADFMTDIGKINEAIDLCNQVLELEPRNQDALEIKKELVDT